MSVGGCVNIQGLIIHGNEGSACGGNIHPVALGIAAEGFALAVGGSGDRSRAVDHIEVELRLNHDVHGIAVNDLPQAIGADALRKRVFRTIQVLVPGGGQICLDLRFVTGLGNGAKVFEAVGILVRRIPALEGEGLCKVGSAALQPAGLGHIIRYTGAIVLQTPGVVGIVLADLVLQGLCAGSSVSCSRSSRLDGLRVEVIILEVEREICVVGNRHSQRHRLRDGQALGDRGISRSSRVVDRLCEDIIGLVSGLHIGIPQGCIAGGIHHEGVVGIAAGNIGISVLYLTAHDGHDHTGRIVSFAKVGAVGLFGCRVDGVQAQVDLRAAASAAIHIRLGGQRQAVAAEINIVLFGY